MSKLKYFCKRRNPKTLNVRTGATEKHRSSFITHWKKWGSLKIYLPMSWSPVCSSVFSIIITLSPFVNKWYQVRAVYSFLSCLHEGSRERMLFHYNASKCLQVMLQRERWHTWRLCIQDQRFLQWLVEARNAFFFFNQACTRMRQFFTH